MLRHITTSVMLLTNLDQLDASIKSFKEALAIKPDYADAHYNLGNAP